MLKFQLIYKEIFQLFTIPFIYKWNKPIIGPLNAGIFLTNKCNSRCNICNYWKNEPKNELTTKEWFNVIDQLKTIGISNINFTADGEIFTRKDTIEIIKYAKNKRIEILINTNGLAISEYIEELISINPLQITVSLDAFNDETYFKIRGIKNGFSKVINNIELLKENGYSKISVGSVLTIDNLDELPLIQEYCLKNNFIFRVTAFQFEGFGANNNHFRSKYCNREFLEKLNKIIENLKNKPVNNTKTYLEKIPEYYKINKFHPLNCVVGFNSIFIYPDGDVGLCNLMREKAVIGNIKNSYLKELWQNTTAKEVRQYIKEKRCMSCWLSCFAEENLRYNYKYLFKHFFYFIKKFIRILK